MPYSIRACLLKRPIHLLEAARTPCFTMPQQHLRTHFHTIYNRLDSSRFLHNAKGYQLPLIGHASSRTRPFQTFILSVRTQQAHLSDSMLDREQQTRYRYGLMQQPPNSDSTIHRQVFSMVKTLVKWAFVVIASGVGWLVVLYLPVWTINRRTVRDALRLKELMLQETRLIQSEYPGDCDGTDLRSEARQKQLGEIQATRTEFVQQLGQRGIIWEKSTRPIRNVEGFWIDNRIRKKLFGNVWIFWGWNSRDQTLVVRQAQPAEDMSVWTVEKYN